MPRSDNFEMLGSIQVADSSTKEKTEVLPSWGYATKKSIASSLLNVSLLMTNAKELKTLYDEKDSNRGDFWKAEVFLVISSIVLQVVVSILLFVLSLLRPTQEHHRRSIYTLNNVVVGLILLVSMINIIIAGFGFRFDDDTNQPVSNANSSKH